MISCSLSLRTALSCPAVVEPVEGCALRGNVVFTYCILARPFPIKYECSVAVQGLALGRHAGISGFYGYERVFMKPSL